MSVLKTNDEVLKLYNNNSPFVEENGLVELFRERQQEIKETGIGTGNPPHYEGLVTSHKV